MNVMKVHRLALALAALASLVAGLDAQRLGKKYYEDSHYGYRFRYPDDWEIVPQKETAKEEGLILEMQGPSIITNSDRGMVDWPPRLFVFSLTELSEKATTGRGSSGLRAKVQRSQERPDISHAIVDYLGAYRTKGFDPEAPEEDSTVKIKKIEARHRTWEAEDPFFLTTIDTWTFPGQMRDICIVYYCPEEEFKKFSRTFRSSAKTFEPIDIVEAVSEADLSDYEGMLAYHSDLVSRDEGWRVLPTPSRKFIVKTSSDDDDFLEEVIERLEKSRELFEKDFPPPASFKQVSVVRVCKDEDEFMRYGRTRRGVAGWFSPVTTELVLFDAKMIDRRSSFAVMTHEAFHQYCFYLFDQSEAHRWFDEGHGDYYGGAKFSRNKVEIERKMPAGLNRYDIAKSIVRSGAYVPLEEHIRMPHREWQSSGGSTGVANYCQSWALIFFLREGTNGDVSRKYWKKEYADIIPRYVSTLHEGFLATYDEILMAREEEAKKEGRELTDEEVEINRFDLEEKQKQKIWDAAIEKAWGKIDMEEFEENWVGYIRKL